MPAANHVNTGQGKGGKNKERESKRSEKKASMRGEGRARRHSTATT